MNLLLKSRDLPARKRKNKTVTLLIMGGFALSFAMLGYAFDYTMGAFNDYQVVTIPVAVIFVVSLIANLANGLNDRFFGGTESVESGSADYQSNKLIIWVVSTTVILIVWMCYYELSYIDPRRFGSSDGLFVIGETTPYGLIAGSLLGIGASFSTLQWGAYSILRVLPVAPASAEFENDRRALNAVEALSRIAGIKTPALFVLQDDTPNSFSVGRSPRHSTVVVSQGLLETLETEELTAVLAHEIGHIRAYDTRVRTATTALFGSILLLSSWAKITAAKGAGVGLGVPILRIVKRVSLLLFWILSLAIVPGIAYVVVLLTSRQRILLADISAAELTRNPDALIRALHKIEQAAGSSPVIKRNIAHLCIIDPLNRSLNHAEGQLADLFATHPPTSKRIFVLQSMAQTRNRG